jgi:Fe-S oxidoreductase
MESQKIDVPVMADLLSKGEKPEYLLWVGCAGAFDDRYKKVVRAFTKILSHLNISFGVLGKKKHALAIQPEGQEMKCFSKCRLFRTLRSLMHMK